MITVIRKHFKQSTLRTLLLLLILFMLVIGMILPSLMRRAAAGGPWAIRVNNEEISYKTYAMTVTEQREYLAHIRAQFGQFADYLLQSMGWLADPKALAFDMLVKEELLSQYADKLNLHLHPDYIAQAINNQEFAKQHLPDIVPAFIFDASGNVNMEILRIYLQRRGLSISEFDRKVERALARYHVMSIVESFGYTPSFDSKQQFIADKLGKKVSFLTFEFDDYLAQEKEKEITQKELQTFYDAQNKQFRRYFVPEKRAGIMWKFSPQTYGITVSDEEIKEYYEDNKVKKYVDEPVKVHVRQITQKQLPEDVTIEDVRAQLLEDPSSWKDQWKTLKPFARGQQDEALERAAFLLKKEGDISSIVETKDGKVIIQLIERIARTYKPLSEVKKEIKDTLVQKKFKANFVKDMKDIIAHKNKQEIATFIAQKGGKKEIITDVIKEETRLSQELFAMKKNTYSFYVDGATGIAVTLTDIQERYLPSLDSIKDVVKNDMYEERARKAMKKALYDAKKEASQQHSFEELKNKFNVSLDMTDMIKPDEHKKISSLEKRGLPARAMLNLEKEGLLLAHEGERVSYLIKLDTLEAFDQEQFMEAKNDVTKQLEATRNRLYVDGFVASLYRNATIETNESILTAEE